MSHEHHHNEEDSLRPRIIKIAVSALLLAAAILIEKNTALGPLQLFFVYLVPYLAAGLGTIKEAIEGIIHGDPLDENFLMTLATVGALGVGFFPGSEPEYPEAVFVMLFFQVGELFESIAEGRSKRSVEHLVKIRPETANILEDGRIKIIPASVLKAGDVVLVRPGEKVPSDGEIIEGRSEVSTQAITGESLPREVSPGEQVLSGFVNGSGSLTVRISVPYAESTASRVLDLVQEASRKKSSSERFITRFARVYTPIVALLALLVALVPPLFFGGEFSKWIYNSLTFLIVSCPCALVLSVPLAFFGGIGSASRVGILVKGSNFLEALSKLDTAVFDKTGTLTKGVFSVVAVHPETMSEHELLHVAAHVERHSTHPIAASLLAAYPEESDDCEVSDHRAVPGKGTTALVNGKRVAVGNAALMEDVGAKWHPCHLSEATIVHVALDGEYMGHILIYDTVKEEAAGAVRSLRKMGLKRAVMLTGDSPEVARKVAGETGMDEFYASLLPGGKVQRLESILSAAGGPVAFVGDGMNDAPVLSRADVGVAMGGIGSAAAIEAADVVIMNDDLRSLPRAVSIGRRTLGIARENIIFAIGIKLVVLILAAFSLSALWMAVFADVGVTVLAVLNSMRSLRA